jgi:Ser/Thr protein kinase RdoA (MazF antagonist)
MDRLSSLAVEGAAALARSLGVTVNTPLVLKDASNVVVHLAPAPVVARVATSTALVRPDASQWMEREIALVRFLVDQGAPVVGPSAEVDPGPHVYDGYAISFWNYVEHDPNATVTVRSAATVLRELHAALMSYPGELPYLGPVIDEIPRWLRYLQVNRVLQSSDMVMLREAQWQIAESLRKSKVRPQALHGDAHVRNLLKTRKGLLWTDFEDACRGPVSWDVACLVQNITRGSDGTGFRAAVEAYGRLSGHHLAWEELEPYLDAREFEALVWSQVQATRFPEKRETADALLETWRNRV